MGDGIPTPYSPACHAGSVLFGLLVLVLIVFLIIFLVRRV